MIYLAAWPLISIATALGLGRWLRSRDNQPTTGGTVDSPTCHRVRSECVRAAAFDRIGHFGDEDFEEWGRELAYEEES